MQFEHKFLQGLLLKWLHPQKLRGNFDYHLQQFLKEYSPDHFFLM
jgi:hypothetical protein